MTRCADVRVTVDGAWTEWLLYLLAAVRESTTRMIAGNRTCQEEIAGRARAAAPGGRGSALLDTLLRASGALRSGQQL